MTQRFIPADVSNNINRPDTHEKLEKILAIIISVAFIFKLLSIPGMSLFVVIPLLVLIGLYFYFGFALFNQIEFKDILKKYSYQRISNMRILGAICVGLVLSLICVGILFKIQHWYSSAPHLYIGLSMAFILLVISLFKFNKSKDDYYKNILIRLIPCSLIGAIFMIFYK
jgi:uncharacterized membrane protein